MSLQAQKQMALQWGLVAGLLAFSFVALSGIALRVEPFVIAQRALGSAAAMGFVAHLAVNTLLSSTRK